MSKKKEKDEMRGRPREPSAEPYALQYAELKHRNPPPPKKKDRKWKTILIFKIIFQLKLITRFRGGIINGAL